MGAATPPGSSLRRRVGCCHQADDADAADPTAFSFREVPLSLLERLQDGAPALPGPPIRLSMGVFPPATDLYTGDMALAQAASRIDVVVATNRRAGVRGLTFGAGRVRSIPEAMPRPVGERRLAEVLGHLAARCRAAGIVPLVENLPRTHSNVLNTVTEIVGFLDRHGLDGLRIVFDQRAALLEGENPADVIAHLERVGHVHIAYPQIGGDAEATTRDLVDGLLDAGYGGGFSVEPHGVPLDAGAAALGHRIATWITDAAAEPAT